MITCVGDHWNNETLGGMFGVVYWSLAANTFHHAGSLHWQSRSTFSDYINTNVDGAHSWGDNYAVASCFGDGSGCGIFYNHPTCAVKYDAVGSQTGHIYWIIIGRTLFLMSYVDVCG